jgi:hypothetical protein
MQRPDVHMIKKAMKARGKHAPTESTSAGSSKRPHRRRGHWRTLSHPKYRHHPQYQQKIWVKPAFIGPLEEVHEGNMYRLIDQGHGMVLH